MYLLGSPTTPTVFFLLSTRSSSVTSARARPSLPDTPYKMVNINLAYLCKGKKIFKLMALILWHLTDKQLPCPSKPPRLKSILSSAVRNLAAVVKGPSMVAAGLNRSNEEINK